MKMLALVSWTCLAAFAACGQAEPIQNEVVDVVATGSGLSPDEAEKDALRNAVETVVGQYVGTSTTVEDDELIEDKILTYSAGFVETYDRIGEPRRRDDGLVSIKIKATVKRSQLVRKLQSVSIGKASVSGKDLFASTFTRMDEMTNAQKILAEALKDFPAPSLVDLKIVKDGDNRPLQVVEKPESGTVRVSCECRSETNDKNYAQWVAGISDLLSQIARNKRRFTLRKTDEMLFIAPHGVPMRFQEGHRVFKASRDRFLFDLFSNLPSEYDEKGVWRESRSRDIRARVGEIASRSFQLVVLDPVKENANVATGTTYLFEGEGASMILSAFSSRMVAKKCVRASLKASDEEMGMGVDDKSYTHLSQQARMDGEFGPFIRFGYCNERVAVVAPSVSFKFFEEHFNSPKPIDVVVGFGNDSVRLDLGEFSPEQLRAVTSVECSIEFN
ncbi:MAG: hypothetical protein PHW08_00345 [Kiritimatiellae bacterium]|nr:hypothetical protein [Kiritimatiellia bacterium]